MHYKETTYGFEFGAAKVDRLCSDKKKGWVMIAVTTPKTEIYGVEIYVTKTGKVRIYKDGKEARFDCDKGHALPPRPDGKGIDFGGL